MDLALVDGDIDAFESPDALETLINAAEFKQFLHYRLPLNKASDSALIYRTL
jgi:hypothetical protein